ncbi:Holliday junction branch migration protein RuvA [Candidatus Gracilibacteria bacterium]|nr:Holliday junction branch migration protein RuvA [Candidatus Gracilibacteria bacterium]
MISLLIGTLELIDGTDITLLTNGVGYTVTVQSKILGIKDIGDTLKLWIYHHQTEAGSRLIGFETMEEKRMFSKLLSVNGLGPKGALSLLELGQNEVMQAIASGESKRLTQASGVGPKLASKIIVELRGSLDTETLQNITNVQKKTKNNNKIYSDIDQSIINSLTGMGYERKSVESIIEQIPDNLTGVGDRTVWCIRNLHQR